MMTYGFGIGVKNVIQKGVDKDSYAELMTDIMKNVKAIDLLIDVQMELLKEKSNAFPF